MSYGVDRWLYPIEITAENNGFVVEDSVDGVRALTIPAGIYYQALGDLPTGKTGLWAAIKTALDAGDGTYSIAAGTPSSSSLINSGVIVSKNGAAGISIRMDQAGFTMDKRLWGYPYDRSTEAVLTLDTTPSQLSIFSKWQSANVLDGAATDKRRVKEKEIYASTQKTRSTTRQNTARDTREIRTIVYEYVPGLHVYPGAIRAGDASYTGTAGLPSGDENNAFEDVWDSGSELNEIIIIHDEGDEDLSVTTHPYEIVLFDRLGQREFFSECVELMRSGGEMYRISTDLLIMSSTYDY